MLRSFQFLGSQRDYMLKMHIFSQKLRFYEIKNFHNSCIENVILHIHALSVIREVAPDTLIAKPGFPGA